MEAQLREGLASLGVELSDSQVDQLLQYAALLQKWGKVYNLTALLGADEIVTHHLLDSLAVVKPVIAGLGGLGSKSAVPAESHPVRHDIPGGGGTMVGNEPSVGGVPFLLDVGSGAGLPGAVIAIACPGVKVDCVDAVAKKAAFIQQAAGSLKLPNLRGVHSRVESLQGRYDLITSRAFSSLHDFVTLTGHLLAETGVWGAMKGRRPDDEIAALPADVTMFHVEQLKVPGLDAERCLVWLKRAGT
jgi:16S rRNA (guanine527-N7)-methyltransferase